MNKRKRRPLTLFNRPLESSCPTRFRIARHGTRRANHLLCLIDFLCTCPHIFPHGQAEAGCCVGLIIVKGISSTRPPTVDDRFASAFNSSHQNPSRNHPCAPLVGTCYSGCIPVGTTGSGGLTIQRYRGSLQGTHGTVGCSEEKLGQQKNSVGLSGCGQ